MKIVPVTVVEALRRERDALGSRWARAYALWHGAISNHASEAIQMRFWRIEMRRFNDLLASEGRLALEQAR